METITIKKVKGEDLEQLQEISKRTFSEAFSSVNTPEDMAKYLEGAFSLEKLEAELGNADATFYFAQSDSQVIGYLKINQGQAQTDIREENGLEIERIYVLPAFQGREVGQQLYGKAMEVAAQQGKDYLWLGVWEHNLKAIHFYQKNGFAEFNRHPFMLGDDEQTDIMMRKSL